jgi:hypothetical protein
VSSPPHPCSTSQSQKKLRATLCDGKKLGQFGLRRFFAQGQELPFRECRYFSTAKYIFLLSSSFFCGDCQFDPSLANDHTSVSSFFWAWWKHEERKFMCTSFTIHGTLRKSLELCREGRKKKRKRGKGVEAIQETSIEAAIRKTTLFRSLLFQITRAFFLFTRVSQTVTPSSLFSHAPYEGHTLGVQGWG